MAFQTAIPIKDAIGSIETNEYVLPAIQREFVWRADQIERLFDSLMRGYPIGAFLFWRVEATKVSEYNFYDFVLDYHEKDKRHNEPLPPPVHPRDLVAVLDGQQRLTALNIGLRGSHATKLPRLWWSNPAAFPRRRLHLNLLADEEQNEDGLKYDFRFLRKRDAENRDETACWFRVDQILRVKTSEDLLDVWDRLDLPKASLKLLMRLHQTIHSEPVISAYEEKAQDLDKVVNIFVRTNSGGTTLAHSDILLTLATAQWGEVDARSEIHDLVDDINGIGSGFRFSKDFVLKACLLLGESKDVGFKIKNFQKSKLQSIQRDWWAIKESIRTTVELAADFGYSSATLSATNALLPLAYFVHRRKGSLGSAEHEAMRSWLRRSLLKRGVWGSGLDSLLGATRDAIRDAPGTGFPAATLETIMSRRAKSLSFDEEELEDLVDTRYGDPRAFGALTLLYPFVDVEKHHFHVDHVFPKALFTKKQLKNAGVRKGDVDDFRSSVDCLANLQLLEGRQNQAKGKLLPAKWLAREYPGSESALHYAELHDLGDLPDTVAGFLDFFKSRRRRMLRQLRSHLGTGGH